MANWLKEQFRNFVTLCISLIFCAINLKKKGGYIYRAWIYVCSNSSEVLRQACMIFLKLMRNACTLRNRVSLRSVSTVRE